ncbi:unnamed protein product [Diamesa serratosioi]
MWTFAAILTFAPLFGVGIYYDEKDKKCLRYRDADDIVDVTYAFVFFIVGTVLCINMVICNFSVTRIVYRSYHSMQIILGPINSTDSWNRTSSNTLRHRTSELSANTNKSINLITRDELKFVTMINCLTTSFVVCWGCQMITIPIAQFIKNANKLPNILIFFKIADILILIHFGLDPFIYVLMKTNYWMRLKSFICELKFCKSPKKKFLALPSSSLDCQL